MAANPDKPVEPVLSDNESTASSKDDEGWDDVEPDEEEPQEIISLLDDQVFPDILSMLSHCKEKHSFDFLGLRQRLQLDFHGSVKLVNYIRQRVHAGLPVSEDIKLADIDQDQYLKPVLDDDAVILNLFDLPEVSSAEASKPTADGVAGDDTNADLAKQNAALKEELERMTEQFQSYRTAVQKTLDERWGEPEQAEAEAKLKAPTKEPVDESKHYWESYAGCDIHETMLKDSIRTEAYRDFIYNNKHLFAGKTVLDIGCGSGILSMFCARAGASQVIAVDASTIITKARENIYHNGLSDVITCLSGRVEEVKLPVDSVDIIVSEWMGYGLLFEAMLPSVLWARDRYLKPDGLIVPSHTSLWLAPIADPQYVAENVTFWRDVYGFDMHAMQEGIFEDARVLHWPDHYIDPSSERKADGKGDNTVAGEPAAFKMLDLYTIKPEDLSFTAPFRSTLKHDIDALDGFLIWFDTFFLPTRGDHETAVPLDARAEAWAKLDAQNRVGFTTGPHEAYTHWKQVILLCEAPLGGKDKEAKDDSGRMQVVKKGGEISGDITFAVAEDNARALSLKMSWHNGAAKQTWALK